MTPHMNNDAQKIDFNAIMMKPFVFSGVKQIKAVSSETVKSMVRAYHPAINIRIKPATANQ